MRFFSHWESKRKKKNLQEEERIERIQANDESSAITSCN